MTPRDSLAARMSAELAPRLFEHAERLGWDAGTLAGHQRDRLRVLLAHAAGHSRFHARRLRGIDPARFELADLPRLPVMTKAQMMAEFDDIVTDHRLNSRIVERHLAASAETGIPGLLLGEYVCVTSGGTSGLRGIFTLTLSEYSDLIASLVRPGYARAAAAGGPPPGGLAMAVIAAASPVHGSGFFAALATGFPVRVIPVPVTLPWPEIVARLNAEQPPALAGYPTKLAELARAQLAGRLAIAPRSVLGTGGPCSAADSVIIERAFGTPVSSTFACTEGLIGHGEPGEPLLTFDSDMCLAEPVDEDNQPVPPGVPSAKVLLTNLHNLTQPLVRYELTDRFVLPPGAPETGWLRASVHGRAEEVYRYAAGATVDWHPIRHVLSETAVREYQVRQTATGIDVACVADGLLDTAALATRLTEVLRREGLPRPEVRIRLTGEIPSDPHSGKVRPFVPGSHHGGCTPGRSGQHVS